MSYQVTWHPQAFDYLEKLPKDIAKRILNKLDKIKEQPFHYLEHFEGEFAYKLRVGDYRMLVDVDFQSKILKIQVLDIRGRIYKR